MKIFSWNVWGFDDSVNWSKVREVLRRKVFDIVMFYGFKKEEIYFCFVKGGLGFIIGFFFRFAVFRGGL